MKKEITIPEKTVEVETRFRAFYVDYDVNNRGASPFLDTYEEAVEWIAKDLSTVDYPREYEIKARHGRFASE
jgi:hypothetical protein